MWQQKKENIAAPKARWFRGSKSRIFRQRELSCKEAGQRAYLEQEWFFNDLARKKARPLLGNHEDCKARRAVSFGDGS
ncbi:MAG TPA: hypothetical protein DEA96_05525 [Leptospiraceae bacterium]|nr:hypothetical protein [Spirochaetaceae bacterium]HBS04402.1 hypothetical protein [Leptospiraceae bacterium]